MCVRVEGGKAARPSIYCWRRNEMGQSLYPLLFPPSFRTAYIMLAILSRSNSTSRSFIFFVCSSVLIQAHRVFILPEGRRRRRLPSLTVAGHTVLLFFFFFFLISCCWHWPFLPASSFWVNCCSFPRYTLLLTVAIRHLLSHPRMHM